MPPVSAARPVLNTVRQGLQQTWQIWRQRLLGSQRGLPYYHKLLARQVFANPGILSASARLIDVLGRKIYTPLAEIPFFQPALPYVHHGKPRKIPPMGGKTFREINHENRVPIKARGRVALFYGCAIDQIYPHLGKTAIETLNDAGFEVFIPKELTCCGAPVLSMGDIKTARKMMETNLSVLAEQNVDAVITLCATCGSTLKELYPKLFGHDETHLLSDKIMDFQEFLVSRGLFEKAPDTSEKHSPLRVTYHDPCHLNRGMNVQKAPREILKNLPDIDFIEMKDADRCCGGGGLFSLSHYDLSLEIGMHKIEAIMESGAEVVATACPSCILHLSDLLQRQGASIQVVHVCELMKPKKD